MVVNFEVGKTYVYNGKIGDPSPFVGIGIEKQDALFIVSGKLLVCTQVENSSCPFIKFDGMSSPRGWALNSRYHLFGEVEKKTVVKEEQKEEKKEMPKFEVGKKYRYTGPSDSVLDFIKIGIDSGDAEYIVSGEPLTVEFSTIDNLIKFKDFESIKFKEFESPWAFPITMLEKFEEVTTPVCGEPVISPDKEYIARQLEWIARNGVKAGTKVRVTRTAESDEDGWVNSWVSSMDKKVGKIGTVDCSIGTIHGLYIDFGDEAYYEYPFFVLEVVDGKYVPAKKFEACKWYVCHLNERPRGWNCEGKMDGLLDGKPHKCIMGNETYAEFKDIPFRGDAGWDFHSTIDSFEEVPAPSFEVGWEKKYAELEKRYNKLKGMFVEYLMGDKVC